MKTKKVKTGELRIDPKLVELRSINMVFVSRYRQAYRSEAPMPLIIVQEGTNRVVSGNHRLTALRLEYGNKHTIKVVEKHYNTELEILEDFTQENVTHGNAIDSFTRKKLMTALLEEGATPEKVSSLFNISVHRLTSIGDGMIIVEIKNGKGNKKSVSKPAKHGFKPEHPITEAQYSIHANKDRGLNIVQQAGQLIRWMEGDLIECNANNLGWLEKLSTALSKFLKRKAVKETV